MSISIVSYGGGTNSKAVLIGMLALKEPPPFAILFADTGGEKPETYVDIEAMSTWITQFGYPPITIVRALFKSLPATLEETMLRLEVLPPIAYGFRTCSQRFKIEPQHRWAKKQPSIKAVWATGGKITKIMGIDYGELGRARFAGDAQYIHRYPLIDWRWDRARCVEVIEHMKLPLPGKSSCFFCPNMRKPEIVELRDKHPELMARALHMEANCAPEKKIKVKGLGRRFAWKDFIAGVPVDDSLESSKEMPCGCYDGESA